MSIIHNVINVLPTNNRLVQKLNEIIGDGLMQADLSNITRTVIAPVVLSAILAITIPGIVSWGILQMLGKV
jgi:HD-like signal output (HDOD) protein